MITATNRISARAQAWIAYGLLGVLIFGPAVCVVWLVVKTVENEKIVVEQLLREAAELKLKDAEALLYEGFETILQQAYVLGGPRVNGRDSWDFAVMLEESEVEAVFDWNESAPNGGVFDSGGARSLLTRAREAMREMDPLEKQRYIVQLAAEPMNSHTRFDDGRLALGMLLEMGFEGVAETNGLVTQFIDLFDNALMESGENRMPQRQRDYLLKKYGYLSNSDVVGFMLASLEASREWRASGSISSGSGELDNVVLIGGRILLMDRNRAYALVYRKETFLGICRSLLKATASVNSVSLVEPESAPAEDSMTRVLDFPLDFVELQLLDPRAAQGNGIEGRTVVYVWIGSIVLLLSVLSGIAIVLFIRGQASSAQLKNDLVATVTHELKTPVSSIRLLIDTMLDEKTARNVNTNEYLELISRENYRLGRLIDNFLSFSRMERDRNSFAMIELDPVEVVEETATAFRERFQERTVIFKVDIGNMKSRIVGDGAALQTALGNLLENALKYGSDSDLIELRLREYGGNVVFEVEDQGKGIPKKEHKKIFERFYQSDRKMVEYVGGVGLGLSIVSFIVSKHNGIVELDSEVNRGSIFRILIPHA